MYLKFLFGAVAMLALASVAGAASRTIGYKITCMNKDGYCTTERITAPSDNVHWYSGVYVEDDGDVGKVRVDSQGECERLCRREDDCVMAEFYYGKDTKWPICNMFSSMQQLKWNPGHDAKVGVFE